MPIASVIIPTYKGSSALNRAIDSVLCQSYKLFCLEIRQFESSENQKFIFTK